MQKKSILITGCSSGIGLATALGLQARGHRVFASVRDTKDLRRLQDLGLKTLLLDLDDSRSIQNAVETLLEQTNGQLDALFNNGAYGQPGAVEDLSREAMRAQFETNLFGTLELTNRVIPVMRQQGHGRIIVNSSVLGLVAMAYRGAYVASKFALEGLIDTLRLELQGTSIHVSLIEPGPIESRFRANAFAMYQRHVQGRASAHRAMYDAMEQRLKKPGPAQPFTLPPEAVLERVVHALESDRPKARYYVTVPTHLFAGIKRLLPIGALDWVMTQVSGGGRR